MDFEGEGRPVIPQATKNWSNIFLGWPSAMESR
jgi:hypothetical protein